MNTNIIETMKQALAALEIACRYAIECEPDAPFQIGEQALTGLRAAIEAAEKYYSFCYCNDEISLQMVSGGAAPEGLEVVGYLDGRGRFFYVSDPRMVEDHKGMRPCYAAAPEYKS